MRNLLAAVLIALPIAAMADPGLKVDQVWSRAAMAGHEGVVYLTITNSGTPDTLTAVSTPVAGMAQVHQTINDNGVMKMRPVTSLPIGQDKSVSLAPGGYHIMLMNLKQTLKQGDSFPVTLTFAKAGPITATAIIEKAGAASGPTDSMPGMTMPMPGSSKP
jgi:copper(I)-binding protein